MRVRALAMASGFVLLGCSHAADYNVARMGREVPPKAEGCPIEWPSISPEDANAKYEILGTVQVPGASSTAELSDAQKARIELEACKLGGEAVSLAVSATYGRGGVAYFVMLPKAAPTDAPTADAVTPPP